MRLRLPPLPVIVGRLIVIRRLIVVGLLLIVGLIVLIVNLLVLRLNLTRRGLAGRL